MDNNEREKNKQEIKKEIRKENRTKIIICLIIILIISVICASIYFGKDLFSKVGNSQTDNKEQYLNSVELTAENWKDYFEFTFENHEIILKLKESYNKGKLENTAIELYNSKYSAHSNTFTFTEGSNQVRTTGTKTDWNPYPGNWTIDDIECKNIKGTLVY